MVGSSSSSSSDGGHDAALLEYLMNADLYEDQAAACCSTLLVRGTEVDGLFIKNSTMFNGRPMFVNEDGGKNKNSNILKRLIWMHFRLKLSLCFLLKD